MNSASLRLEFKEIKVQLVQALKERLDQQGGDGERDHPDRDHTQQLLAQRSAAPGREQAVGLTQEDVEQRCDHGDQDAQRVDRAG